MSSVSRESVVDPPPLSDEERLSKRLEGRGWFAKQFIMAGEGLKFWKFGSKEWAIWHTSSWATYANVFALTSIWNWLKLNWLSVCVPMLKKAAFAVKALFIAIFATGH